MPLSLQTCIRSQNQMILLWNSLVLHRIDWYAIGISHEILIEHISLLSIGGSVQWLGAW